MGINFPNLTIPSNRAKNNFTALRFPLDIGPIGMKFKFSKYEYKSEGKGFSSVGRPSSGIVLPIPQSIINPQSITIDASQLGLVGALTAEQVSSLTSGGNAFGDAISAGMAAYGRAMGAAESLGRYVGGGLEGPLPSDVAGYLRGASYLGRRALDTITPALGLGIERALGTAVNPHAALNFDGVPLKEFEFAWTLSPKDAKESDALRKIELEFKKHILPSYVGLTGDPLGTGGGNALERTFLAYPDICEIEFAGIDPEYYFKFKPGMISNFTMNYSSQGNVILKGGKPGIVTLNITFKESRIHTREDYGGKSGGTQTEFGTQVPPGDATTIGPQ